MLPPKKRLVYQVRDRLRLKNCAYPSEESYLFGIKQFILFHNKSRPNELGGSEAENPIGAPAIVKQRLAFDGVTMFAWKKGSKLTKEKVNYLEEPYMHHRIIDHQ